MNVLVIGASRGIGLELVRQCRAAGDTVTATARDDAGETRLRDLGARALRLDVASAAGPAALAWPLDGERFELAVFNAGVYGPRTAGLEAPAQADFDAVMHTNVWGAMRVLPQLVEHLAPGGRLGVISSQMGAIGPRRGHAGWLYRASKAALNSVTKDVALACAGRATVVALHPGWVRTDMGGASADLDVATSAANLLRLLRALTPAQHGGFFNHDGTPIPW